MKRTGKDASRSSACEFVVIRKGKNGKPDAWKSPRGKYARLDGRRWGQKMERVYIFKSWEDANTAIETHRRRGEVDFTDESVGYCTFGEWLEMIAGLRTPDW